MGHRTLLQRLSRAPIRIQLTVIATLSSTIALVVAGVGFISYDTDRLRVDLANRTGHLAEAIAHHSRAPLSFEDTEAARDTLRSLEIEESVRRACVYRRSGEVFACYPPLADRAEAPARPGAGRDLVVEGDRIVAIAPVLLGRTQIGTVRLEADLSILKERRDALFVFAGTLMLFSFGAALLLSAALQRYVSGPISDLARAARAITADKDYGVRAPAAGPGEVGLLVDAFNEMVDVTAERERELRAEIAERKRIQQEREHLIGELEARNVEMERFNYTVSHDLKSPIITIKGFLGLLERDLAAGDRDQIAIDMEHIGQAATRMHALLDNLLELSRIGRIINPPEDVPLDRVVDEALEALSGKVQASGAEVRVDPDLPRCEVDRPRMVEVFQNLIENAIKFTAEGERPRIEVGARTDGDDVVAWVRDRGVGIAGGYHRKVFDLFDRLDARGEGTGIGLALVRRIVEAHGGRVWVESEGAGHGSTFFLRLPRRAAEVRAASG